MLSIDAGRPATMSYSLQQHSQLAGNMLSNGFGSSRGKPDAIKNIPIPSLPTISASLYDDPNALFPSTPTTRASGRAQLLAGLRTAPKTPTSLENGGLYQVPDAGLHGEAGAFYVNRNDRGLSNDSLRNIAQHSTLTQPVRTAISQDHLQNIQLSSFGNLPTPPTPSHYAYQPEMDLETKAYADLLARNMAFAQQQQQHFFQQLRIAQQTQQLQQMHHQNPPLQLQSTISQSLGTPPVSPVVYSPTAPGQPSLHTLYGLNVVQGNQVAYPSQLPRSKHASLQGVGTQEQAPSLTSLTSQLRVSSSPPTKQAVRTPSSRSTPSPTKEYITCEHPTSKKTPSPPPPPSSASSSFRRGHKKCISLSGCTNMNPALTDGGPKTSLPRLSNIPSTPLNSTFGGRGDHPIRQPRGPPALEEVLAKPTSKHEGSKNFSSRQRRRALHKLVNAGLERRGTRQSGSPSSSMMSVSEHNDNETDNSMVQTRRDMILDNSASYRTEGRRTPKRTGLAAPHLVANAEKRRSAIF